VSDLETDPRETDAMPSAPTGPEFTVLDARVVPLGGLRGMAVARTLPNRELPTVGAWCFLDHFGPDTDPMSVLPHPHTGLQTVTWLFSGEVRHRDSVGSDVVVRPGELDVMTSGAGIAHSELSPVPMTAPLHGLQLWVALPDSVRDGAGTFGHHADLPHHRSATLDATVLVGTLGGTTSPATVHSPLVGAQIDLLPGSSTLELDPTFEHAVLVIDGEVAVDGIPVSPGPLVYLGSGRERLRLDAGTNARLMLIGGAPWREPLVMWWNFVAREHDEIVAARAAWESRSARFGEVAGHDGARIPAPPIPPTRLLPRRRRH
jgi:redox-sensitive bicupin YhaK (pirin superfamily)